MTTLTWSIGNRAPRGNRRGFTLVEIIVVVILMSVLAGMAVPMLAGAAGSRQAREQAQALLTAARYAREYAVTHRVDCRLAIDAAAGQFVLQKLNEDATGAEQYASVGPGWGRPVVLAGGVRFGQVSITPSGGQADDSAVVFRPTGQADLAVVEITDGRTTYTLLVVPASGRAKLIEGTVRVTPNDRIDLDA